MRWRVTFNLDEWDEMREVEVDAHSYDEAIDRARGAMPWEGENATDITATPEDVPA